MEAEILRRAAELQKANAALRAAGTAKDDFLSRLVLVDVHLPDIDGEEVLGRLNPATREIPVVVLSADATTTQSDRPIEAGASAYLTKPIDVSGLLNALDLHLGSERTERVTP